MFYLYVLAHIDEQGKFIGPTKVGVTNDLNKRRSNLQTGNPSRIGLYLTIPFSNEKNAYAAEKSFHDMNKIIGLRGEWFDSEPHDFLERYFCSYNTDKIIIKNLNDYVDHLKVKITSLELALSAQHMSLDEFFQRKWKADSDKLFKECDVLMQNKYKELIEAQKSKEGVFYTIPSWYEKLCVLCASAVKKTGRHHV